MQYNITSFLNRLHPDHLRHFSSKDLVAKQIIILHYFYINTHYYDYNNFTIILFCWIKMTHNDHANGLVWISYRKHDFAHYLPSRSCSLAITLFFCSLMLLSSFMSWSFWETTASSSNKKLTGNKQPKKIQYWFWELATINVLGIWGGITLAATLTTTALLDHNKSVYKYPKATGI